MCCMNEKYIIKSDVLWRTCDDVQSIKHKVPCAKCDIGSEPKSVTLKMKIIFNMKKTICFLYTPEGDLCLV